MAQAGSKESPRGVGLLVGIAVALAAGSVAAAAWLAGSATPPQAWWRPLAAVVVIAAGWRLHCSVRVGGDRVEFFWGDAAMVLATGLVTPAWLVVLTAPAVTISLGLLPGRQQPIKATYNTAMAVCASTAAMLVLAATGATPRHLDSVRDVLGLGLAALVYVLICDLAVSAVIAVHTGRRFVDVRREGPLLQVVSLLGNLAGAAAVWLTAAVDPRLLPIAVLAVLGTQQGYTGLRRAQHERHRRHELAAAVSRLTEATGSPLLSGARAAVLAAGGDDLLAAEAPVLRRAAELAGELFGAVTVEIELFTESADPADLSPRRRSWLYRHTLRAAEPGVFGTSTALPPGPKPDAVADIASTAERFGQLRLAFGTSVASSGLDEREQADLATFAAAVPAALQVARRQAAEQRLRAEAEHTATHDPLTGLPNRQHLLDVTARALARVASGGTLVATGGTDADADADADAGARARARVRVRVELTLVEVTGLRELASAVGHAAADRLIVGVAERLAGAATGSVLTARLDGGCFAVLTADRSIGAAAGPDTALRLRRLLAAPIRLPSGPVTLTTVTATATGRGADDADELLRQAEVTLAVAHRTRSRSATYDQAADVESTPRMMLVGALAEALRAGTLDVCYQLARDLVTGKPASVEAQPCWTSPTHGHFTADDLLDLVSVDVPGLQAAYLSWLLPTVLGDQHGWVRQGVGAPVAIRLPLRCLLDPALPDRVAGALADAAVPADQLVICVDDALPTAAFLDVTEVASAIADLGVRIAVDRLSVLEQLPTLPVHELRLAADLVSEVSTSHRAAALVAGAIATAASLGLHTTARGVESDAQAGILRDMGCSAGQGDHVALTVDGVRAGRYLWATGLLSDALHPNAEVVVLARQRDRRRRPS